MTVRDGWVTLNGTVPWQFQRAAAEKAIEHLHGVKGVANAIVVKAPVASVDVRHRIEEAFKRSADVDAARVTVEAHNGTVVLKGTVPLTGRTDRGRICRMGGAERDRGRRSAGRGTVR